MNISENISLAPYTTFKIGGPARFFCSATNEDELAEAMVFTENKKAPLLVLGGGSNVLISDHGFAGLVVKMAIRGLRVTDEDNAIVAAGAGEVWDDAVAFAVGRGLYGIENLSAIPGTVGAAPVQNIGAYGTDVSRTISSVRAMDTKTMRFVDLSNIECQFSYRDSRFKHEKGRYIITEVVFNLSRQAIANTQYKDVSEYFRTRNVNKPTPEQVREAVIEIRAAKLPDWKKWGTAGSFFKNPIVTASEFECLKKRYPDLPGFPEHDGRVKIQLGWILDKVCDAKGLSNGKARVYEKQALVLVAEPGATSEEVTSLAYELMKRVKDKTGIEIEGEVEWVN